MKKDPKKRGDSKNTVLRLEPEAIWDTFLAQLLVKIDAMLKPKAIDFKDYIVTFSVPRIHPKVTDLADEDMYKFMVERALRSKDRTASITVEPIVDTKVSYPSLNMCIYYLLDILYPSHPMRRRTSLHLAQVRVEVKVMTTRRRRRKSENQRRKRCVLEFKLRICGARVLNFTIPGSE